MRTLRRLKFLFLGILGLIGAGSVSWAGPDDWRLEWAMTDFSKSSIDFGEIISGGPPKDGIPAIDQPIFIPMAQVQGLEPREGIVSVSVNGETKGYPLRILMWHEIVNDQIGGEPVAVTYCPLCNVALVFKRTLSDGRVLDFGTTGKLRNSDLIMYDRQSESWWQQFNGRALVGAFMGSQLEILPSRLESWGRFQERFDTAQVLIPNDPELRNYGQNPYVGYAKREQPFLYSGQMPRDIAPMASVLVIDKEAWPIAFLKKNPLIRHDGLSITWTSGQAQAVEGMTVFHGQDIGNVVVQKQGQDVPHHLSFAFAFYAFHPDGIIHQALEP